MLFKRISALIIVCLLLAFVIGCDSDDSVTPKPTIKPTMANIWPHADGSQWTYEGTYVRSSLALPDSQPDTSLPSMEALYADLQQSLPGTPTLTADCDYLMAIDDTVTTRSGVTAQRIVETFEAVSTGKDSGRLISTSVAPNRLLKLLAQCRPDLRDALKTQLGVTRDIDLPTYAPILLGGYAFAYEDSGYYSYGDMHTGHSWEYLAGSLDIGTNFSITLAQGLAYDCVLYGRVWSTGDITLNGRQFKNVVECMYIIDLGLSQNLDENGEPIASVRNYIYGTVYYAPAVGPIRVKQRNTVMYDPFIDNSPQSGIFLDEYILSLTDVSLPK